MEKWKNGRIWQFGNSTMEEWKDGKIWQFGISIIRIWKNGRLINSCRLLTSSSRQTPYAIRFFFTAYWPLAPADFFLTPHASRLFRHCPLPTGDWQLPTSTNALRSACHFISIKTFPESFKSPTDHLIITKELIIAPSASSQTMS